MPWLSYLKLPFATTRASQPGLPSHLPSQLFSPSSNCLPTSQLICLLIMFIAYSLPPTTECKVHKEFLLAYLFYLLYSLLYAQAQEECLELIFSMLFFCSEYTLTFIFWEKTYSKSVSLQFTELKHWKRTQSAPRRSSKTKEGAPRLHISLPEPGPFNKTLNLWICVTKAN
jgi:hypothetical protein